MSSINDRLRVLGLAAIFTAFTSFPLWPQSQSPAPAEEQSPDQTFRLGSVQQVTVTGKLSTLSSMTQSIDETEIRNHNASTVAQAVDYLPGVAVQRVGPRNESGISIRGFDLRESPLYVDGIPIYVPYDGYVDLNRFLTSDISEIQISKGYTSPLLGPNTLGGAVNLITRVPQRRVDADMAIGTGSGNALESWLHLGSRWKHFYFLGSLDWLQSDFWPLSGNFPVMPLQPNDERANSYQRDEKFSGRIGWTPRGNDQYVFTFINQKGEKGNPPYAGNDPLVKPRYWQWPYWNKTSYYFNSYTGVTESGYLKFRGFYDQYGNGLNAYDDATYSTMTRPSSFISQYDDHTDGGAAEFGTSALPHQTISTSFFFKDDTHREHNLPNPFQTDRDQQTSFGFEDVINILPKLQATAGFSADHLNGLIAEDFQNGQLLPFPTDHTWTYNPEASLSYMPTEANRFFAIYAKRSRFPTIKDRYSYRFGQALPNPYLAAERADNWSVGYSRLLPHSTFVQADLFRSNISGAIEAFYLEPNLFQLQNIGEEIYQGAEFVVRSAPTRRLTINANYTFLNRSSVAPSGIPLPNTPKHKTIGMATFRGPRNILLLATARYESGRISQDDAGIYGPASNFSTMDLGTVVPIKAGLDLQAGIKNIFDRNYFYVAGYPELGRNWYFNVRYRF
ncbi:MAG TPA: TonB-dependent receptor plug domain-containing protein [Bryobacteraceae bacterium]|nr:TonB-dependent receptor plug domain-containing protein [Bryobacteraceae bacterium]